jgi:hypothetical protein
VAFDWSGGNIEQDDDCVCIPGQIVFFLEVTEERVGIEVSHSENISGSCESEKNQCIGEMNR